MSDKTEQARTAAATSTVRILLADDHQMFREAMRHLLEEQEGFQVVRDVCDGRTAVALAGEIHPDVLVIDVTMPELNGIEATRQIKASCPDVRIVGLSMHTDREFVTEILAAGASGYVLKDCPFSELVNAIRAVVAGDVYLSPKVTSLIVKGVTGAGTGSGRAYFSALSPREREILQMVADGGSSKEIAYKLGLSVKTVDTHRRQVMEKLQMYSTAELTHYAIREGVTPLH